MGGVGNQKKYTFEIEAIQLGFVGKKKLKPASNSMPLLLPNHVSNLHRGNVPLSVQIGPALLRQDEFERILANPYDKSASMPWMTQRGKTSEP